MTDTKEPDQKKPLSLSNTLSLKKSPEAEQVRQSFSHGRSKPVTVEVKKKRINMPGAPEPVVEAPKAEVVQPKQQTQSPQRPQKPQQGGRRLSNQEQEARMRAVQAAMQGAGSEQDPQKKARELADQERRRMIEDQKRAQEEALVVKAAAEEKVVEETILDVAPVVEEKIKPAVQPDPAHFIKKKSADDEEEERKSKVRGGHGPAHAGPKKSFEGRRANSKSFGSGDEDGAGRVRSMAALKRAREKEYRRNHQQESTQKVFREVVLPETISVQELANRMTERAADVVKTLMKMGMMVTINQVIDADTAELVVAEMGHKVKRVSEADIELALKVSDDDRPEDLLPRAPVVTVMGHVDHGKTSLLDALRQTDIVSGEAGGITQHIGAYQVHLPSGKNITFVDTPGHAAFTEMRARGANITDVVILVVAADDGIMEQTIEAIHHAKAAGVPIVVAINKMDKPDANPDRVRNELLSHDIVLEEFGGDVMAVEVSAKAKLNLDKLEEAVLLQAEILDLKANPNRAAEGAVVEARIEKGRGSVATVLIQKGTLKVGDIFVAGCEWGRVRALYNDHGRKIEEAFPSEPVEVLGFDGTPGAGDDFVVVESENKAREIAEFRTKRSKDMRMAKSARGSMEQMFSQIGEGSQRILSVVIKSDVQGSLEAITTSLAKLETPEVSVKVLHAAVGGINESDVILARASNAFVVGFNVRANPQARELSGRDGVDIRYYSIIYDVIDDMKAALSGLLSPTIKEQFLGYAEIREVFNITKVGKIAGCMITSGVVKRGAKVRLLRDNIVIHEGSLKTLKRFKDEVKEAKEGFECGMAFENYHDIRTGDVIECFEMEEIARTL